MLFLRSAMAIAPLAQHVLAQSSVGVPGVTSYVAPAGYPTTAFSSYYPIPSGQEPQPALYDPVLNITYPLNLTNPDTLPDDDPDPVYYPRPTADLSHAQQKRIIKDTVKNITGILSSSEYGSNCTKCQAALSQAKSAAQLAPTLLPDAMVSFCTSTGFDSAEGCSEQFRASTYGAIMVQVLAFADVSGLDGEYICNHLSSDFCDRPMTSPLDPNDWFPKPKPDDCHSRVPKDSGKRVKVAHLSDFHLDPRYKVGSEGNCTSGLCCRSNVNNSDIAAGDISYPAPLYGYYECDTPYDLGLSALQAVGPLTGTSKDNPLAWTIYTGDLVSHDPLYELSRLYTEYAETSIYDMLKSYLTGPVFPVLGNHDTNPEAINAPHSLPGKLGKQMSWNTDHVSALWKHEGWIKDEQVEEAKMHYGAYSIKNHWGLRMITFNSDFWYRSNLLNYINTTNPDVSGTFAFVIAELQAAEDAGERVWLFAHVLSGWDGSNPMPNPTNLFYQIVERYSPHVIAHVFFGHTHEDEQMIYYARNGSAQTRDAALTPGWIGPSVTPLTNLNAGFRAYDVDPLTGEIWDAYTFISDVSSYPALARAAHGPVWEFEYSTRAAYGAAAGWPSDAPLNATFWHAVTEAMEADLGLVQLFNHYEGKSSVMSPNCTDAACARAKVCYMRSGSVALGRQCAQGYGSVQSAFEPA